MSKKFIKKVVLGAITLSALGFGSLKLSQALFSDVETLENNTAGAATVNLQLAGQDPTQVHFDLPNIMPGSPQSTSIGMTDIGTGSDFNENLYIDFVVTDSDEGINSEAETDIEGEGELDDCLMLSASFINDEAIEVEVLAPTLISDLASSFIDEQSGSALDNLLQSRTVNLDFEFSADNCGNEAMGDNIAFDMLFYYEQ